MMEYHGARKKDSHVIFINLEKTCDKVLKEVFLWAIKNKVIRKQNINIVQDMYQEVKTNDRTCWRAATNFPITIGHHRGSTLSTFLFVAVLDEMTWSIQGYVPWFMLFADDIILVDKTKMEANATLEQ